MKYKALIFILLFLLIGSSVVFAHPLDISVSTLKIDSETNKIDISTYLHPFEVGVLLEKYGIQMNNYEEVFQNKEKVFEYIQNLVSIKNNGKACNFISANIPYIDEFVFMGDGLEVQYIVECENEIEIIDFSNELFIEDFELQTNKMLFYETEDLKDTIYEVILTSKVYNDSFNYYDPTKSLNIEKDSDQDGLTDLVESEYYSTNEKLSDTDFDGYSDKEEIDNGWDPLDPSLSPGQIAKKTINESKDASFNYLINSSKPTISVKRKFVESEASVATTQNDNKTKENVDDESQNFPSDEENEENKRKIVVTSENRPTEKSEISGSTFFKTGTLKNYLVKIKELFDSDNLFAKILIFLLVFSLGVLHALESGHGKTILASYLIEENKGFKDAIRFNTFFTITHLVDVVFLAVLFKLFSLVGDSYKYVAFVQKTGAYILLLIASFLVIKSIFPSFIKNPFKVKKGPILAVIAGLAPCTFGWAIMVSTISLNKTGWLIPMIIVFGFGIFLTLMVFSAIVLKVKKKISFKFAKFARYSYMFSASFLFIIAVTTLFNV